MLAVIWLIFVSGFLTAWRSMNVRRARALGLSVAQRLGLTLETGWFGLHDTLRGTIDGVPIEITWMQRRTQEMQMKGTEGRIANERAILSPMARVVIDASQHLPRDLSFESEGLFVGIGKLLIGADIEVEDSAFDAEVLARGDPTTIVALMDQRTRSLVRGIVNVLGAKIHSGRVEVSFIELSDLRRIESLVRTLVELVLTMRITEARSIPSRLAENAVRDPLPSVRRNNLSLLLSEYRASPEAVGALELALEDRDPGVSVLAASVSGPEGLERLREIAFAPDANEEIRIVALRHIAKRAANVGLPLLERALREGPTALRRMAIETLGRMRHAAALPELSRLACEGDAETASLAAAAIGWIGAPSAEHTLLGLLAHSNPNVRAAAARSLGRVGARSAIKTLKPLTKRHNPVEVRAAAEHAIAQLVLRHGGTLAGSISLTEPSNGALSLDREVGQLSTPPGPPDAR